MLWYERLFGALALIWVIACVVLTLSGNTVGDVM